MESSFDLGLPEDKIFKLVGMDESELKGLSSHIELRVNASSRPNSNMRCSSSSLSSPSIKAKKDKTQFSPSVINMSSELLFNKIKPESTFITEASPPLLIHNRINPRYESYMNRYKSEYRFVQTQLQQTDEMEETEEEETNNMEIATIRSHSASAVPTLPSVITNGRLSRKGSSSFSSPTYREKRIKQPAFQPLLVNNNNLFHQTSLDQQNNIWDIAPTFKSLTTKLKTNRAKMIYQKKQKTNDIEQNTNHNNNPQPSPKNNTYNSVKSSREVVKTYQKKNAKNLENRKGINNEKVNSLKTFVMFDQQRPSSLHRHNYTSQHKADDEKEKSPKMHYKLSHLNTVFKSVQAKRPNGLIANGSRTFIKV
ncbi:hypothetical protein ABK040_004474 [Willaertia magna]